MNNVHERIRAAMALKQALVSSLDAVRVLCFWRIRWIISRTALYFRVSWGILVRTILKISKHEKFLGLLRIVESATRKVRTARSQQDH